MGYGNRIIVIDPSPYQPHKCFDENSLRELGVSIVQKGLIEPIIVRTKKGKAYLNKTACKA